MKKKYCFITLCLLLIVSFQLKAQILAESFNYPAGDSVQQHGWSTIGTVFTNQVKVVSPGLDFIGYQLPGIGNSCNIINTGQDVYKQLSATVTSGSIYGFFLVRIDTARAGGDYFAAFLPAASTTNFAARVYVRKAVTMASNNISFGIIKNALGGGGLVYGDSTYTTGTTYLLVAKHTFVAGTANDQVSLLIYSPGDIVPASEPAPTVTGGASTTADVADIGRFAIRQGQNTIASNGVIDEIWVGTDWASTLPVELTSFTSSVNKRDVLLNWNTSSEINNMAFDIERSNLKGKTSNEWIKIGNVLGNGTTSYSHSYSFSDRNLNSGNYSYRLKQIDFNGNFEYFNLNNEVNIGIPSTYAVSQNYPNPFNPSTLINFDLPYDGKVSIKLFDMSGKEVATLIDETKTAGYYSVKFNAAGLSSGVYFYNISADNFSETKKMLLIK